MATTRSRILPIAICLAFGLAACGDDSSSTTTDAATTPVDASDGGVYGGGYELPPVTEATAADTTVPETSATDAPDTSVDDSDDDFDVLLSDSNLGSILTDFDGYTLYMFASDPPNTVTCTGGCASAWPGVPADDSLDLFADLLDESLFSTATGADGNPQLTYNGHPLYYYSGDTAPGDTNGQGVGGVWFAIDAEGNAVT